MHKTVIKQKLGDNIESLCIVCVNLVQKKRLYRIDNTNEQRKSLQTLLSKYGGINVDCGVLCKNCYNKLQTLGQKCNDFYELCQKSLLRSRPKRMASSPAVTPRLKDVSNAPLQRSSKRPKISVELFSAVDKSSSEPDSETFSCDKMDVSSIAERKSLSLSFDPESLSFSSQVLTHTHTHRWGDCRIVVILRTF